MKNVLMTSDFYTITDADLSTPAVLDAAVMALTKMGTTPDLISNVNSNAVIVVMKAGAFGTGGAAAAQTAVRAAHASLADATVTIATSF